MNRTLLPGLTLATITACAAYAAGPDLGAVSQAATNWPAIGMFLFFVVLTLGITYKARHGHQVGRRLLRRRRRHLGRHQRPGDR